MLLMASVALAQTTPPTTSADLPRWILEAIAKAEASAVKPPDQPGATGCPIGDMYKPVFRPGQGLYYECLPIMTRDKTADWLTYANSGLIVLDSTLTGYLVWNGVAKEANPLMVPFFTKDKPWRVGVKGVLGAAQTIALYRMTKPKSTLRYASLGIAIAINGYACAHNYLLYRDAQQKGGR
jgi:hypothetical protein